MGIHFFVDGALTDTVQLNTSVAGTHSIDYVITGIPGLTSTSTRTVAVAPANDNVPPEQASSTPPAANDNPQPQGAEQSSHDDNSLPQELPATGTD